MCPVWTVTLLPSATVVWKLPWMMYKTGRGAVFQLLFDRSVMSSSLQVLIDCSTPGIPVLHYLPEFAQTRVHWVGDAIQPSHPLSAPSLPALNLSQQQDVFQWVSSLHQVAKVLAFSFNISPSNEYSGLISCRIDWFDLIVQGTLKSLLQHHSLKTSILWHSAFSVFQ